MNRYIKMLIEYVFCDRAINNAAPSFPGNFRKAMEEFDVNDVSFPKV